MLRKNLLVVLLTIIIVTLGCGSDDHVVDSGANFNSEFVILSATESGLRIETDQEAIRYETEIEANVNSVLEINVAQRASNSSFPVYFKKLLGPHEAQVYEFGGVVNPYKFRSGETVRVRVTFYE